MVKDQQLRRALLAMAADDRKLREELAADGSLFEGYHPEMRRLHSQNAEALLGMIRSHGWPGRSLVGEDGAEAAWLIAQHAIAEPKLQREALILIREAAKQGEAPFWQAAMLEDRIRMCEGRPQIYGTQFDWDENGEMSPSEIEDPESVDERRREVGLGPLQRDIMRRRAAMKQSLERPPEDLMKRREEMEEWARKVGWRED